MLIIAVGLPVATGSTVQAAVGDLLGTYANPTPFRNDLFGFGRGLTTMGGNLLVGAPNDRTGALNAGAAYLIDGATGDLLQTFLNPSPEIGDAFGVSVAGSGDRVLIGSWHTNDAGRTQAGAAYVFDATTGDLLRTYYDPAPSYDERFGWALTLLGNNPLIGTYKDNTLGTAAGSATLFNGSDGSVLHSFFDPTPAALDRFGRDVAVFGNDVVITAYRESSEYPNSGGAYIFDSETGELLRTLLNPTPDGPDHFGESVSVFGNHILIGAPDDANAGHVQAGAAYLFDGTTGDLLQSFYSPTPNVEDNFGYTVALWGDYALVGSRYDDTASTDGGAAYLFNAITGQWIHTFTDPTPEDGGQFGWEVAWLDGNVLIADPRNDQDAEDSGVIYLFEGPATHHPEPSTLLLALLAFALSALHGGRHARNRAS